MPARRLTADWVVPVAAPPIARGAVLVGEDGRIAAIGPDDAVPAPPGAVAEPHPGALLLPGLVNAHTHLELTGLAQATWHASFPEWIRHIRQAKAARAPADFLAAARQGVRDCWREGVTTVADTGDTGAVAQALAELGGRGIAYHEVFGPHPDQRDASLAGLQARVAELAAWASPRVRIGVSPHAPYTVSGPLLQAVTAWAREAGLPVAMHLAESLDEHELFVTRTGGFAQMWQARGIPLPEGRWTPVEWVEHHGALGEGTLCVHVVHATERELALLAARGCGIAHCPLSNRAHRHGAAPLAAMRRLELAVGVGTDSVVSVGRLDLRAEARAAGALAGLDAAAQLRLCTLDAARAIGLAHEVGSLEVGKWGDLSVWRPAAAAPAHAATAAGDQGATAPGAGEGGEPTEGLREALAALALAPETRAVAAYIAGVRVT